MRRHVIIGRLGAGDRAPVVSAKDEVATRLALVSARKRLDHGIGRALDDLLRLGLVPAEIGCDLLILAAHVHAADTRISRTTESQDSWTREIRLVVPVSDPARWSAAAATLRRMLDFLTGDRWVVDFRLRPPSFRPIRSSRKRGDTSIPFDGVSLFSGGLDSLIGAIDQLETGAKPLFVSHAGDGATSAAQQALFTNLGKNYAVRSPERLRLAMSFPKGLVRGSDPEDSTRGRSFLFFALGIFAGTAFRGPFTLQVPENGSIAINVPLDPLRLGSNSTRTTHPFYVTRWNELLSVLGIRGRIENPYWNKTKGEMVASCGNQDLLRRLIPTSLSCSSPTKGRYHGHGVEHCGYCLPCVIRRAALARALGPSADPTVYSLGDLAAGALDTTRAEGQQVRSFQVAAERLGRKPELARLLIHKPGPLSSESPDRIGQLADVYRRGMDEVASLLAGVRTRPG